MKHSLFSMFFLFGTLIAGCSEPNTETAKPITVPDPSILSTTGSDSESDSTISLPRDSYPEKAEVLRLMYRANTEFDAGRFNDSLEIVEQALQLDPTSVVALELKNRITEILLRS